MPPFENEAGILEPRGSRRRPDVPPRQIKRIRPRSGLSRVEVLADQRQRMLDGMAIALVHHGYEDTKITDIVELSGVSRPTFYEHFDGKDACFAAAYADGVERLAASGGSAAVGERGWPARLASGLAAGLDFLAADSPLANLLLVESLAASRPARLEHERELARLARALRRPAAEIPEGGAVSEETARLLAGGVTSHLSGRVLAGEAERLSESHELLLHYLLAPSLPAVSSGAGERRAAGG